MLVGFASQDRSDEAGATQEQLSAGLLPQLRELKLHLRVAHRPELLRKARVVYDNRFKWIERRRVEELARNGQPAEPIDPLVELEHGPPARHGAHLIRVKDEARERVGAIDRRAGLTKRLGTSLAEADHVVNPALQESLRMNHDGGHLALVVVQQDVLRRLHHVTGAEPVGGLHEIDLPPLAFTVHKKDQAGRGRVVVHRR